MKIRKKGIDWQEILLFVGGVLVVVAATRKNQQVQMIVEKVASFIPAGGSPPKSPVLTT